MLLTGLLAGTAAVYGTYKYNAAQNASQNNLDVTRDKLVERGELTNEERDRLKRYESTYGNTFNNVLLDKLNPNSIIRSNRKSHKLFNKTRAKIKELEQKKAPYENEMEFREKDLENGFTDIEGVTPTDTYKPGKYVVGYDYLNDTPNYMLSYTNTIFGHMHFGLKGEMKELRKANADKVETDRTMNKNTLEYKLLVESQADIESSRKVKNEVLKGNGFFSKVGKYATKRFGNFSDSGRALKRHNTLKKRVKRNIAMYQADSLKAYRELYSSLADEKELLDAKSEDVVKKFDDIFFADTKEINNYKNEEGQQEGTTLIESKLAFDPMQVNLDYADTKGELKIISHNNNNATMSDYKSLSNLYLRLVKSTHDMREGKGDNYGEIIQLIKDYGNIMDGGRFEKFLPMCHGFFRTGTMRRAMSAGLVAGTDNAEGLSAETKRTLDFARVMLTQCITQAMFDTVNNNPDLFVNLEAFGKLSANYQLSKLAATALMNRTDFLQNVNEEGKKEAEKDQLRLKAGSEYYKKLMRDDIGDKDADKYDKYIDNFLSSQVNNDPAYRDIVESIKNIGANEHTENFIKKEVIKTKNEQGQEVTSTKFVLDKDFEKKCKEAVQIKDGYDRLVKPMLASFGDKRGLIRMYVEKFCKDKTLGLKRIEDKLVETIEDKLGADMLVANWWTSMVLGYQVENGKADNIGKLKKSEEKGKNKKVERVNEPLVGDELLGALSVHFAHLVPAEILDGKAKERCNKFKETIVSTLQKQGGNCVFDIEKLWMNDQKLAAILSDDGQDADKNFDEYIKSMTQTLSNNISVINNRTQVVANSFVFNSRRNKVYDYIGANIFTGGAELIKTLTDYAIDRIMKDAMADKATETLEKNVAKALDMSVLENRWKISSMTALNAKLMAKGEDPASYTVEKLVELFNEWNDTFAQRSNQIVTLYQGIYMSPAQIEKEMAFFDENAWMEEEDFKAAVNQHIEEFTKAKILKTKKGKTDVSIDGFLETMTNREKAYEIQPIADIEELFREEITTNAAYASVFKNLMSVADLFDLMKKTVKKEDDNAATILSLNADELNKLSIAQYSEVKGFIERRLLPLAKYLDTVPTAVLTNAVRDTCIERAMKGELELISVETLVNEELAKDEHREEINKKRSFLALSGEGTEMGEIKVDNSRMQGTKKKKDDPLTERTKKAKTAATFWNKMWADEPEMAKAITIAFDKFNSDMQALREQKMNDHLIKREEAYTNEKFHEDYSKELERFVRKLTKSDEKIHSGSEICNSWYKALPLSGKYDISKKSELENAVKSFINKVRKFVKDNGLNAEELIAAKNEFALMGNADILLSVGEKYEDTFYKTQDEYEEDIHNIINRMMKTPYVANLVEQRNQFGELKKDSKAPNYDEVKKLRKFLLSTKSDETNIKRRILFGNVDDLAKALLKAGEEYEVNERTVAKIFGRNPEELVGFYRSKFEGLKKKSDSFNQALKVMDQLNDGSEEELIKIYNEFFAEIEKASETLFTEYQSVQKMNETYKKEAEANKGKISIATMDDAKKKIVKYSDLKFELGNESFILGVKEIIADNKEAIKGEEMIKNLFREIRENQEENLHRFGAKNAYDAYVNRYYKYKVVSELAKEGSEGAIQELESYKQIEENYRNNCDRIQAKDKKLGVQDRMAIFISALEQDDRFIELMTEKGEKAEAEIDAYLNQFKTRVAPFLQAITKDGKYAYDMTTVIPQFIEHHKNELLKGSDVFTNAEDYRQELDYISNAWMTRKSAGKSANDVKDAKASKKLAVTKSEKQQIVAALMREGTVSLKTLSDSARLEELLREYKSKWDANMNTLKQLPSYKKLAKIPQNGTTDSKATVADLLVTTFTDKIITMSEEDLINLASTYAEQALEINKSRSIKANTKKTENWDYVKERKIKEDINRGQVKGRNALAAGNAAIRKAADCYYNGVSILSNAKKNGEKQKLISADEMDKNREKVRLKIEALKAKKGEGVDIKQEDLDILTELYSTGNVWSDFPLLWKSNIEEAFESLRKLRTSVRKAVDEERKLKKGNTGLTDEIAEHDINRFILFMAAHGRLQYEGGADGFIVRKSKDLWHWFKNKFGVGAQDIQQEYEGNELSVAQMFESYGRIQSEIDNFTAEGLNIRRYKGVVDQCNSDRIALQMAMFSMHEIEFNDLKDERKALLTTSVDIETAVTSAIKSNMTLDQSSKELEHVIEVLTRGFIDYYGEDIKKLIPVRKEGDKDVKVLTDVQIKAERVRIMQEITDKLSGEDVMYYIKAFTEADEKISAEEKAKRGPVTKSKEVSVNEFEASVTALGEKRAKRYAEMSDGEKNAIALIISQPFRFLATDRVGAINMVMDHVKVTDAYFHKMDNAEENRSNAAAIDVVNLLTGKQLESKIDYTGAYERLSGIVGTKGGKEIFDQAVELLELCKERVDFYKTREWDNIDDPEKSIKLAGLVGKSKATSKEARKLKNSKGQVGMKIALSEMVSSSTKAKLDKFNNDNLGVLITLLQNRSILDESTVEGKEGMAVNSLMREQVVRDLCLNSVKKADYQENANKQMYINKAIMTLLSFQVRDDVKMENGVLKIQDILESSLNRSTIVDEKLLVKAIDMANAISELASSKSAEAGNMPIEEFNDQYNNNEVLSGKKKQVKYSNDLDGILYNVNSLLKSQSANTEFSVFKDKAGEKAMKFRQGLYETWEKTYAARQAEVAALSEADKIAFEEAKAAIDKMVLPVNMNDEKVKGNKIIA